MKEAKVPTRSALAKSPPYLAFLREVVHSPTLNDEVTRVIAMCRILIGETATMSESSLALLISEVADSLGYWKKEVVSHQVMQKRQHLLLSFAFSYQNCSKAEQKMVAESNYIRVDFTRGAILTSKLRNFGKKVMLSIPNTLYPELVLLAPDAFVQLSLQRWLRLGIVSLTSAPKGRQSFDLSQEFMVNHYLGSDAFAAMVANPGLQFDPDTGRWSLRPMIEVNA